MQPVDKVNSTSSKIIKQRDETNTKLDFVKLIRPRILSMWKYNKSPNHQE